MPLRTGSKPDGFPGLVSLGMVIDLPGGIGQGEPSFALHAVGGAGNKGFEALQARGRIGDDQNRAQGLGVLSGELFGARGVKPVAADAEDEKHQHKRDRPCMGDEEKHQGRCFGSDLGLKRINEAGLKSGLLRRFFRHVVYLLKWA